MTATALQPLRPELPTEIWHHIFRLATEVEGEFDPLLWSQEHTEAPLRDIFTCSIDSTYINTTRFTIDRNFPTRRYISSVSRRWRRLGITVLYSSVTLKSHTNMVAFLHVLKQSAEGDANSGGLAQCVRRITFGPSRFAKFENSEYTMARILSLCKNLVILVDDGPSTGPGQFPFPEFPPLAQCPNLRYIFGKRPLIPLPSSEPWKWLLSMQNLHAITLEYTMRYLKDNTPFPITTIHLPRLHTLQFADDGDAVARLVSSWDLPSLRNLFFTEDNSNQAFNCILQSHGHKIEKFVFTRDLVVYDYEVSTDSDLSPPSLPRLRFLSMPSPEPRDLPSVTPLITSPNLETIVFLIDIHALVPYGEYPYPLEEHPESVGELLDVLLNRRKTPSLRTVQFLNLSWEWPRRITNGWLKGLEERFWERGVRLQIYMAEGSLYVPS